MSDTAAFHAQHDKQAGPSRELTKSHIAGDDLYGDDFSEEEIRQWFAEESLGYFNLKETSYSYEYDIINSVYGFAELKSYYKRCLALGCARGDDILPVASRFGEIIAVEPAKPWWREKIGETKAIYMMPKISGALDIADSSIDIVTCFGVLHHIPNVSAVISELARVCAPGATVILREPSHSMGDFRLPRNGLTKNERGIAPNWLLSKAAENGFRVKRLVHYDLGIFARVLGRFGVRVNQSRTLIGIDRALCRLLVWNHRYWRTSPWHKLSPSATLYHLEKI
jgi:SAM-dependent methyltransferase